MILLSRSSKTQRRFRLLQFAQGCRPEHLIFCLRHRAQLCPDGGRQKNSLNARDGEPYALEDRFVTRRCSLEFAIAAMAACPQQQGVKPHT